jgi:hypothetical protein
LREPFCKSTVQAPDVSIVSTRDPLCVLIGRMKSSTFSHRVAVLLTLPLAAPLFTACGSSGPGTGTGAVGNVVIKDTDNYSAMSSLTIPTIQTKPASDLTITWAGITKDLLCHTAMSIDNVAFVKIPNKMQATLEHELAEGTFNTNEQSKYGEFHTAGKDGGSPTTTLMLSQLAYGGATTAIMPATDYVESATTLYLMLFAHGTTPAVGAQSMVFIQPTSGVANTTVSAPDACASNVLDFTATLSSTPVSIPTDGPWKVDWSQITKDSFGNKLDFSLTPLNKVEVGFFQGKQPADIQAGFLDIEQNATALYTYSVPTGQKYVDLMSTPTMGGTFPGFADTNGTYAVAVLCSTCTVPAPVVFSILQPQ